MRYRFLGSSGIQLSEIGFGCMSLSSNTEKQSIELIHRAIDEGINFFDTADLYDKGRNESIVGKAVSEARANIILATKVGNQWRPDGSGWDWNPRKEYILQAAEGSLIRLKTDYIDLYQLHGGTIDDPIDETIEAFEQLKQQGKIRHYGISSIRPNVIQEFVKRSSIVSVMMQYSLADRRPEENILGLLQKNNISVLARGTLAQGVIIDKPPKVYPGYSADDIGAIAKAIQTVSGTTRTAAQTAIQYALHHPAVTSAVIGIRTSDQLQEVTTGANPLQEAEYRQLQQAAKPNKYEQHRIDH